MGRNVFDFETPKTPLQWLIFLAAIGVILSSPVGTRAFLKELKKHIRERAGRKTDPYTAEKISQALYYAKKRKLLRVEKAGEKTKIVLTEKGKKRKLEYDLDNLRIPPQKPWDEKWRIVMFDIPETKRAGRTALTHKLKTLGFLQFQKSVWIYPYPCKNEIDFVTELFALARYVNLITVKMANDKPLQRAFALLP